MNAGTVISITLACALLCGCASDQPAPDALPAAAALEPAAAAQSSGPLRGLSCEKLDADMADNYSATVIVQMSGYPELQKQAELAVKKFKAAQKEYKSRCKGEPKKLNEARKGQKSQYLPN